MKGCRARWLALACFVLALSLVYSCSEDSTTCPTPTVCSDPTKALLGTWTVFESYTDGMPDQMITTVELDFQINGTMFVRMEGLDTLTWLWMADKTHILIGDPSFSSLVMRFEYEFEADTLDMTSVNADMDFYWRLYK
jgi:hypothetical protein